MVAAREYESTEYFTFVRSPRRHVSAWSRNTGNVITVSGSIARVQAALHYSLPLDSWPESL